MNPNNHRHRPLVLSCSVRHVADIVWVLFPRSRRLLMSWSICLTVSRCSLGDLWSRIGRHQCNVAGRHGWTVPKAPVWSPAGACRRSDVGRRRWHGVLAVRGRKHKNADECNETRRYTTSRSTNSSRRWVDDRVKISMEAKRRSFQRSQWKSGCYSMQEYF